MFAIVWRFPGFSCKFPGFFWVTAVTTWLAAAAQRSVAQRA